MKEVIHQLEILSKLAKKSAVESEVKPAIAAVRLAVKNVGTDPLLQNLDSELSTWQSKLSTILKEPIGRQGMSRHCLFWVEKLKK